MPQIGTFSRHFRINMLNNIHNIADNGTGRRQGSGALSVKHDITYTITAHIYGIIGSAYIGQGMIFRNKGGMNCQGNSVPILLCYGKKLNGIPHSGCMSNIFFRNAFNSFDGYILNVDVCMKTQFSQDGDFSGRIKTAYVAGRIRLGITFFLRFF